MPVVRLGHWGESLTPRRLRKHMPSPLRSSTDLQPSYCLHARWHAKRLLNVEGALVPGTMKWPERMTMLGRPRHMKQPLDSEGGESAGGEAAGGGEMVVGQSYVLLGCAL